jgi:predicted CopG family antitoxin
VGNPVEQSYTWTGKETRGQLVIRLTAEKTSYSDFILTRENPKIKDDIAASMELKRKKEAEEQKRKILEEYNKFK